MWWIAAALAATPDNAPALIGAELGRVEGLSVAEGRLLVGVASGELFLLDVDAWEATTDTPCSVSSVAVGKISAAGIELWVGCTDGKLLPYTWREGGDVEVFDPIVVDDGRIVGTWVADETVYAAAPGVTADLYEVHRYSSEALDGGSWPVSMLFTGYSEGVVEGTRLYLHHGGDNVSSLLLSSGQATASLTGFGLAVDDVAPRVEGGMYGWSTTQISVFLPATSQWSVLRLHTAESPGAIGSSYDAEDPFVVTTSNRTGEGWTVTSGNLAAEPDTTFPLPDAVDALVQGGDGWMYGAGKSGGIVVISANPWVEDLSVSPAVGVIGTEVAVTYRATEDVTWELFRGGDRSGTGAKLASGALDAGQQGEVVVTIDDGWVEGDNRLYVRFRDAAGNFGHASVVVTVDNPPSTPDFSSATVTFGDKRLELSFPGVDDADLDHYSVYVTTTPFDRADWPTGGPAFDGTDELEAPFRLEGEPGGRSTVTVSPLTNEVTYYLAARAYDAGGQEGPMSLVIEGTPRPSFSASELAGEEGGCDASGGRGVLGAAMAAAAFLRRRRGWILAAGLAAASPALAAEDEEDDAGDLTPQRGMVSVRYGSLAFSDQLSDGTACGDGVTTGTCGLRTVYGNAEDLLLIDFGPQLFRIFDLDFQVGFLQHVAARVDSAGEPSGDTTMLTIWPLGVSGAIRGQFLDEQVLVPYLRGGLDAAVFDERWDNGSGSKTKVKGVKSGMHYGLGVSLLLDTLGRDRASLLESQTGINDTFLTVEWRRQVSCNPLSCAASRAEHDAKGFAFDGSMVTAGLLLTY